MSDSLAAINVDQLSSAVRSVVQASTIGQLPLDPSPPPGGEEVGGDKPNMNVVATSAPTCIVHPVSIPCSSSSQISTQPTAQGQSQSSTLPGQNGQLYSLKQIGNNFVLVPTSAATTPPQQSASLLQPVTVGNASLLQPGVRSNEALYQPTGGNIIQGTTLNAAPAIYTQSVTPTSLVNQHTPHINMNIAIHIPSHGPTLQLPLVNQAGGCSLQAAAQPIRSHQGQDSASIHPQIVNILSPPSVPQPVQIGNSSAPQLVIVPNKAVAMPTQPLTSQPHVTSVSLPVTIVTPPTRGNPSELVQFAPSSHSSNLQASSLWGNHASNLSLISPTLNVTSQAQSSLSPLTSLATLKALQSSCQDNQIVTLNEALQLQQTLLKANHSKGLSTTESQSVQLQQTLLKANHTKGTNNTDSLSSDSSPSTSKAASASNKRSKVTTSHTEKCTSSGSHHRHRRHRHRSPSSVILDKPIMSRARQSLPDMLALKPSSAKPCEMGVYAKQEIAANTRFGPLIGHLSDVSPSQEETKAQPKTWKIFADGKLHQLLHTADESHCNWMMFIQMAHHRGQHNLSSFQTGQEIYFASVKPILVGQELVVSSSKEHGTKTRNERSSKCRQCGEKFSCKAALAEHAEQEHSPPTHATKRFRCTFCPRSYPTATKLKTHLLVHKGVKPHCCEICGKGFTDRSNMKQHMLIHTGSKQYVCDVCGRSFRQKTHLQAHEVTHTGKKDLECPVCHKMFGRINDLSFHVKQHREGKKFHCGQCDASFWKESQLARHTKIHTGERDHQCHLCGKGFITGYHLNRHLKACERDERFLRKPWPGSSRRSSSSVGRTVSNDLASISQGSWPEHTASSMGRATDIEASTSSQTHLRQEVARSSSKDSSTLSQSSWTRTASRETSASSQAPWATSTGSGIDSSRTSASSQAPETLVMLSPGHETGSKQRDKETREQPRAQSGSHRELTHKASREDSSRAPGVLRSSRGRPIRPKILPSDVLEPDEDQPLRKRARRRTRPQVAFCTSDGPVGNEGPLNASPIAITVYEVPCTTEIEGAPEDQQPSLHARSEEIEKSTSVGHDSPTNSYQVHADGPLRVNPESTTYQGTDGDYQEASSESELYSVPPDSSEGGNSGCHTYLDPPNSSGEGLSDPGHQQSTTTLSQLAIAVPQASPGDLECDDFTSAASLAGSQLESSYVYNTEETSENEDIDDAALTSQLFDLSDGTSMSSASQSISAYNPQTFDLGNDDSHSDAFDADSQVDVSTPQTFFMSDAPTSSDQTCLGVHQSHDTSPSEDTHPDDFTESQMHDATSQALFMSAASMVDSSNEASLQGHSSTALAHDAHSDTYSHIHSGSVSQDLFESDHSMTDSLQTSANRACIESVQTPSTSLAQDTQPDTFQETHVDSTTASQALFALDDSIARSLPTSANDACIQSNQTPSTSLAQSTYSEPFHVTQMDSTSASQALFATGHSIAESLPTTSNHTCLQSNQTPSTSMSSETLFSMVPSEDSSGPSLPRPAADDMDDITVDLVAIEGALDSDDDQCTDERRGDSPPDNIEE